LKSAENKPLTNHLEPAREAGEGPVRGSDFVILSSFVIRHSDFPLEFGIWNLGFFGVWDLELPRGSGFSSRRLSLAKPSNQV
jgi:hypothetical protein